MTKENYRMPELSDMELSLSERKILEYLVKKRDSLANQVEESDKFKGLFMHETCLVNAIIIDVNHIIEEVRGL